MIRFLNRKTWMMVFAAVIAAAFTFTASTAHASAQDDPADAPAATTSATDEIGVLINERQCNVGERPKQIVLFLGIGGEDGQRCFGGTIGSINIGNAEVFDLYTGGYTGAIDCTNRFHQFRPEQIVTPIDQCQTLTILPGS